MVASLGREVVPAGNAPELHRSHTADGPLPQATAANPNLWRRFRGLAVWKQLVAWVVAALVLLFVIVGVTGGGNTNKKNVSTVNPTTPATTAKATTTTVHHTTTVAPTTAPPKTLPPTTVAPTVPPTTAAPPPPTTAAPVAPTTPVTAAPAAPPATGPGGCGPLSNEGNCYEPGQFCRNSDHGASGVAGDGKPITCRNNDGWRWEPS